MSPFPIALDKTDAEPTPISVDTPLLKNVSGIATPQGETDISVEESRRLPYLQTGDVFISSSHLGRTTFARIRMARTTSPHTENPFDELKKVKTASQDQLLKAAAELFPISTANDILAVLPELEKRGLSFTREGLISALDQLAEEGKIQRSVDFLGNSKYEMVE